VEANIARNSTNRLKMAIAESGRFAKSAFAKLCLGKNSIELIVAKLYTGRTHQIRVHLAHLGRHILGDILYGYRGKEISRVFLHARLLYFKHPKTGDIMEFEAPLFDDMKEFLDSNFEIEYNDLIIPNNLKGVFDAPY
ncbi:MAG: RluA family pseudouridine synthase, partial [Sulfurovaceae bacterium]|nr:RluA family pseudouridine synthase [Sulfurovaceae bacterium]